MVLMFVKFSTNLWNLKVKIKLSLKNVFMPPAWKVRRGHLVIGSSIYLSLCLSACLSVIPSRLQNAIFKVLVLIQWLNLDYKFIYGFLTLHWHHMPLGWGWVKIWDLEIFAIFWLCCRRGHPCFTNTCLVDIFLLIGFSYLGNLGLYHRKFW